LPLAEAPSQETQFSLEKTYSYLVCLLLVWDYKGTTSSLIII